MNNIFAPALSDSLILAASGSEGATNFLESGIGLVVVAACGAVALLIAIIGIFRAVGSFMKGKAGEGFKIIIMTLLLAGILFSLPQLPNIIGIFGEWFGKIIRAITEVTG